MNAKAEILDIDQTPKGTALTPAPAPAVTITPMTMIDRALSSGAAPETLERLLALQERWEAGQARKAFDAAMATAKEELTPIITNRRVNFESKDRSKAATDYRFEDLAQIERQVAPILTKNGLSYRYRTEAEPEQPVRVTCIVAHRDGHSEQTSLAAGRDTSGNKNSIQAIGSTITYLQRYTLKAALGLAVSHDDDGKVSEQTVEDGPITDDQVKAIQKMADEVGADLARFCTYFKIDAVPDLPRSQFERAITSLEKKRAK